MKTSKTYEEEALIEDLINKKPIWNWWNNFDTSNDEYCQANDETNRWLSRRKYKPINKQIYYIQNVLGIGAWCNDGTYQMPGSGACSHHGGCRMYMNKTIC
jgi:hypothetical protein